MEISEHAVTGGFSDITAIVKESFGSIDALYEQGREVTGLATHYIEFDRMTSGLQESELIIIAARPSMGKTAWAINIAENAAVRGGKVVAVFSLEMSKASLLRRMLASQALVNSKAIQTGMLMRDDRTKLIQGLERLMESKMFIDDTPGINAGRDAGEGATVEAAAWVAGSDRDRLSAADDGIAGGEPEEL